MANQEHLQLLKQSTTAWNIWRQQHPEIRPDLSRANLSNTDLSGADLSNADLSNAYLGDTTLSGANLSFATLSNADLSRAKLHKALLSGATLRNARLIEASLIRANLRNTDLTEANLRLASLIEADLIKANLSRADLSFATVVGTKLIETTLTECHIYGISAWDVALTGALQDSLVITPQDQPTITVDNLKIAQFIYLLLNNQEIRDAIDTIAKKAVLILGRFTSERKAVLDALREGLRRLDYLPILFDFERPESSDHDITGTVETLAHLSRFIILDLTNPRSAPHEAATIIPQVLVPVQPILLVGEREYAMFADLRRRYRVVLPTYHYQDTSDLLASLQEHIILPAEQRAQELTQP